MKLKHVLLALLVLPVILCSMPARGEQGISTGNAAALPVVRNHADLPLSFESAGGGRYSARAAGYRVSVAPGGITLAFIDSNAAETRTLTLELEHANGAARLAPRELLPGKSNYYIGPRADWRVAVPQYRKVSATGVYPGIDVIYYGNGRQLEYDFVVAPGAAADRIRFRVRGATELLKDADGNLLTSIADRQLVLKRPVAYQLGPRGKQTVAAEYEAKGDNVRIRLAAYDRSRELIIDPVLTYATFVGGSGFDTGNAVAIDAAGNAYLAGQTCSDDLPGAGLYNGNCDAYVTAISADGSTALYTTYLGGGNGDNAKAIAVDNAGNVTVVGTTNSLNFPTQGTPFQATYGGCPLPIPAGCGGDTDAFVSRLDGTGALTYSSFLGGDNTEGGNGVAVDSVGNIIVVGETTSTDFPTVAPPVTSLVPGSNVFITRLNVATNYSTADLSRYFNAFPTVTCDTANGVALDLLDDIFIAGTTMGTADGAKSCDTTKKKAFVAKFLSSGGLVFGWVMQETESPSQGLSIAVDSLGSAVMAGSASPSGTAKGLLVKVNPPGTDVVLHQTYSDMISANAVAVDDNGAIYLAGSTASASFPLVSPTQSVLGGGEDAFLMKLTPSGSATIFSTFAGGAASDAGNGVAVSRNGDTIYLAGTTFSPDLLTASDQAPAIAAVDSTYGGNGDAFLAKWTGTQLPYASLTPLRINFGDQAVNTASAVHSVTLTNLGDARLEITGINAAGQFAETHTCGMFVAPNQSCTISVRFAPTSTGIQNGTITVVDNSGNGSQTVSLSGNGVVATSSGGGTGGTGGGNTVPADMQLSASPTSGTITAGEPATYTVTVTPIGGLASTVAFTCTALPANASCTISPLTVALDGNNPATVKVTISTQARAGLAPGAFARPVHLAFLQLTFGFLGLVAIGSRKRTRTGKTWLISGLLLALLVLLLGCGGGGGSEVGSGTQAGTYSVGVTATTTGAGAPSPAISKTVTIALTVK